MEELLAELEQAFRDYREDLDKAEKKRRVTDGLLGFGRTLGDDPCHERLDERVARLAADIREREPSPADAERAVRLLLEPDRTKPWPDAAQWMLRAIERHSIPLIPFLARKNAGEFLRDYGARYKRWDRLPAQQQVFRALKARVTMGKE